MQIVSWRTASRPSLVLVLLASIAVALLAAGCGSSSSSPSTASGSSTAPINAVSAENEYANVIEQIGGQYVKVSAIESNPATDPHTYEASPSIAQEVSAAQLLIENGVGYDTYMEKIESASPSSARKVINVQKLLGLPVSTPNPHLWYKPTTMPVVVKTLAADLSALQPAHAAYFQANAAKFDQSLTPWLEALAHFKATYPGTPVATTEPVADYMLEAAGANNLTPFSFQADIMNGTDPSPQGVSLQNGLFSGHKVKVFVHNQQVTSSITEGFTQAAKRSGIPVVGVYETMPVPGYDYQSWMLAEVKSIEKAVAQHISTEKL
jgi:zinc/manganese transport system substrate-binding protein